MDTKGVGTVLVLVVLGVVLGGIGFLPVLEHNLAVQENQPTTGLVQSTDIEVREDDEGDKSYNPVITYVYDVNGDTVRSDNTYPGRFTRWHSSRSHAQSVVSRYASGDEVVVHYDPNDHGNAYLRDDGMPESWLFGAGYAAAAAFGGIGLVGTGIRRWKQRQLMTDTPTSTIQSLSIGPAEIEGTAHADGRDPLTAPFSGTDCLLAKYEIEEYHESNDDDGGGSWNTIASDTRHAPFVVEDDTGRVLVEPRDAATFDLEPEDWTETYVDSSDRGPASIRTFVENSEDLEFPSDASGRENDRKYRQNLIDPGERVYVYGTARPREDASDADGNASRLVVTTAEDSAVEDTMMLLSDDSQADLRNRRAWALWRVPVGGFFLLVALSFALGIFGPDLGVTLPDVL